MTRIFAVLVLTTSLAHAQSPQLASQVAQLGRSYAPGQVPATNILVGNAPEGLENPFPVPLEMNRCYTFVGTVGPTVQQLSVYLVDPTGKTVAKDTSDRSITPHLTWCTKLPGMYKVLTKIKRGQGEFAVQGFTQGLAVVPAPPPPQYAPPPQPQYAPPPVYAPAPPPPPPPPVAVAPPAPVVPAASPLAAQMASLAQSMVPGQIAATPVLGGLGFDGQENPFLINLQAGRCYTFLGTVAAGVQQLSLYLFDPNGKHLVKDTTDRSVSPRMTYCTQWPGMYKVIAKVKRGHGGNFAVQAFTTP